MPNLIYYLFAGLAAAGILGILLTRNLIYAAFWLVLTFLGVAGLLVLAKADFVAVSQILIYVGGILILLIFGIMLTNRISGQQVVSGISRSFAGVFLSTAIFIALLTIFQGLSFPQTDVKPSASSIKDLGLGLLTDYIFIFEVVGFLLLVGLVGAATIARHNQDVS